MAPWNGSRVPFLKFGSSAARGYERSMSTLSNIKVENFLSLRKVDVRLEALNVLVGANGAGKSNLLKVFQFLGEVARVELAPAVSNVGGYESLLFRGDSKTPLSVIIEIVGAITQHASPNALDEYRLSFRRRKMATQLDQRRKGFRITEVLLRSERLTFKRTKGRGRRITLSGSRVTVADTGSASAKASVAQPLAIEGAATGLGTLRRLSDTYGAPEWNSFAEVVEQLRLFEIDVERVRQPSNQVMSSELASDASNLAPFLAWMRIEAPTSFDLLSEDVAFVFPSFVKFEFEELGGSDKGLQLNLIEKHLSGSTPLAHASYGTIRAIALFAMLHDPAPPKLTCLEEVDHGLHPHALDRVVDRMREASKHTQIILATHSPALVNRLRDHELIVVEREEETGGSRIFRPSRTLLAELRRETGYELGELWFSGALGGVP